MYLPGTKLRCGRTFSNVSPQTEDGGRVDSPRIVRARFHSVEGDKGAATFSTGGCSSVLITGKTLLLLVYVEAYRGPPEA